MGGEFWKIFVYGAKRHHCFTTAMKNQAFINLRLKKFSPVSYKNEEEVQLRRVPF